MPSYVGQKHRPPPNMHPPVEVDALAHCPMPRCEGNAQQPVKAHRLVEEHSYAARDGDWPFTENTYERLVFADEQDAVCGHCGRRRELTVQTRPEYPQTWGQQDFLLQSPQFDPRKQNSESDERQASEMAEMRRMMAAQAEQIAALTAKATRGPGRPAKDV